MLTFQFLVSRGSGIRWTVCSEIEGFFECTMMSLGQDHKLKKTEGCIEYDVPLLRLGLNL